MAHRTLNYVFGFSVVTSHGFMRQVLSTTTTRNLTKTTKKPFTMLCHISSRWIFHMVTCSMTRGGTTKAFMTE